MPEYDECSRCGRSFIVDAPTLEVRYNYVNGEGDPLSKFIGRLCPSCKRKLIRFLDNPD